MTCPDDVARVLRAVRMVPRGRVASYGDIGRVAGVGPRLVGRILRFHGSGVPWWRITTASGTSPVIERARAFWEREGIAVRADGQGCRMVSYRADPHQLAADFASDDLPF